MGIYLLRNIMAYRVEFKFIDVIWIYMSLFYAGLYIYTYDNALTV